MELSKILRKIDLEEALDELGVEVVERSGADVYCHCPDPSHIDEKPSFHVCVEDVTSRDGKSRIGLFNCWSHPPPGLSGGFQVLVARLMFDGWDSDVTDEQMSRARAWLEARAAGEVSDMARRRRRSSRSRAENPSPKYVPWPPTLDVAEVPEVGTYLLRRGIDLQRARSMGVRAVVRSGKDLERCLSRTLPGALFPVGDGAWYVRSVVPDVESKFKGRYPPGAGLQGAGALWSCFEPTPGPVVLVEGIFDADRVSQISVDNGLGWPAGNVMAALGGNLTDAQARTVRSLAAGHQVLALGDGDDGGKRFCSSVMAKLPWAIERRTPQGSDPGDAPESVVVELLRMDAGKVGTKMLLRTTPAMRRRRNARRRVQEIAAASVRDGAGDS